MTVHSSDGRGYQLSSDAFGRLTLSSAEGGCFVEVEPIRAFPITDPDHWVSFCDSNGREVCCLHAVDGLDAASRELLDRELTSREFVPVIERIVRVSSEVTPSDWDVETDRGPTRFTLDSEDDIRNLGPHRVMITDTRKLRYQIRDTRALDAQSRRALDRFL